MVAAAGAEAERNHWRSVVAVVDDGGWVILLERMGHAAMTASVELAAGKARGAALFKKPTLEAVKAVAAIAHHLASSADVAELLGQLQ
jgi:uncharacterized protein GlcG (DUF336 family)